MKKVARLDLLQKLNQRRKKINSVDQKLLGLLNRRLRHVQAIGKIKKEMGKKIYDPEREKEVLEKLKTKNKGPWPEGDLKKIFKTIIRVCRNLQT
jgi:chorismate mutase/prephenate dehydratase